jgi:hypothetical protein
MELGLLREFFASSAALALLRSTHAPLLLAFAHHAYKRRHRTEIPLDELTDALQTWLEVNVPDDCEPGRGADLLTRWSSSDCRFVRKFYLPKQDEPVVELTPDTERVLSWIESQTKQEFVGAESRFKRIFDMLRELVEFSSADPLERLRTLERQKAEIEREMQQIRNTGRVDRLNDTQIRERWFDLQDTARTLLGDFRQIEQNFKDAATQLKRQAATAGHTKGSVVGYVLDAEAGLKESDQGRSFYSFWEFLSSPLRQEEFYLLLEKIQSLGAVQDTEGLTKLRRFKSELLGAGEKVIGSNRLLLQELRHILSDDEWREGRRVEEVLRQIRQLAIAVLDKPPLSKEFLELEGEVEHGLAWDRPVWVPTQGDAGTGVLDLAQETMDLENMDKLLESRQADVELLRRRIDLCLGDRHEVLLSEILVRYPPEFGLGEVLAYVGIAASGFNHRLEQEHVEVIPLLSPDFLEDSPWKAVRLPRVVFVRG